MVERRRPTISTGMGIGGTWHDAGVATTAQPTGVQIRLAKPLERSIRAGHPWVYREALALGDGGERGGDRRGERGGAKKTWRGGKSGLIPKSIGGSSSPAPPTGSAVDIIGTDG